MDNINFLSKILSTKHEYWIVAKKNEYNTISRKSRDKDSIIFISVPINIKIGVEYNDIKLVDLEKLQKANIDCNIFLNDNYPPFQMNQNLYNIFDGHPIESKQKLCLMKALELDSDNLWDYKKLIDEVCKTESKSQ